MTSTRRTTGYDLVRRTWAGLQDPRHITVARQWVHDGTALRPARQIGA